MRQRLWRRLALTARSNRAFRAAHPGFAASPLPILWDAQATTDLADYKRSGEEAAAQYWDLIRPHLDPGAGRPARLREWGCGPGRIIRHLPRLAADWPVEFFGSDYNHALIAWCRAHPPDVTCLEKDPAPPLRVADAFFDLIFCCSVFTHLSAPMQDAWIAELRRTVRPGRRCDLHHAWRCLTDRADGAGTCPYDAGEMVVRTLGAEGRKLFGAFYPPPFVRARLLRRLSVIEHRPGNGTQDIWVTLTSG